MEGTKVGIIEDEEKPYGKIKLRYINMEKAEKLRSVIVAKIKMARLHFWACKVARFLFLLAIAVQLRALGDAVVKWPGAPVPVSFPPERIYENNGFLLVSSNGGLNQMRSGICDMVAVARYLNVTLIVPELDNTSFWDDRSQFSDIFNVDYFINSLRDEVRILKELPPEQKQRFETEPLYSMPPVSWSNMSYYYNVVLPRIKTYGVLHLTKSDARLANNGIPEEVQRLRCRVNYEALRFSPPIEALGQKIVKILKQRGPFLVLHLRYEMDMLAFSGCNEGCNEEEIKELTAMRYAYPWWKEKEIDSVKKRKKGLCPSTPEETALALRALDVDPKIQVYIAAGDIYGGERRLASLRKAFPNLVKKETLLAAGELEPFQNYSNRMAALDYHVAIESNILFPLMGETWQKLLKGIEGHRTTILIDRKALVKLTDEYRNGTLDWDQFSLAVKAAHSNKFGRPATRTEILGKPKDEDYFFTNPQECLSIHDM